MVNSSHSAFTLSLSYPKRLIEVDLPIKRISEHARREKSIRHGHISTLHIWWARRPLEEIGKMYNVTRERIRQIEAKALRKLRHPTRVRHLQGFLDTEEEAA